MAGSDGGSERRDEGCALCGGAEAHEPGCPNGVEVVQCSNCGETMPVAEIAAHLQDAHGCDVDRDEIEQTFAEMRGNILDATRPMTASTHTLQSPFDIQDCWAAVGHLAVTGDWPEPERLGGLLLAALSFLREVRDEQHRAVQHIRTLEEGLDELNLLRRIRAETEDLVAFHATGDGEQVGLRLDALQLLLGDGQ